MNQIELLAPAKDLETGLAAINCGADAVYIGASRFGAREAAGNSLESIAALIGYAHKYWARVYVTVNTLLTDDELPAAVRLIHQLYDAGADALILQDVGLLECDLPPIPLFASTQMHNASPERVAFLEAVGFQRVILARELSLEQIRSIRAVTNIELEAFIHGALCVSYSGQCYLSYALGGRSGNRGQCAQPCRRRYRLLDSAGKAVVPEGHLLSLRDLNLSGHLGQLLEAGVTSFKIEGRLKNQAYVMNVVGAYRQELDALLEGSPYRRSSSGRTTLGFTPDLRKTFNRRYTTYFLHGRGAPLAAWDTPKSVGEPIGQVASLDRKSFTLEAGAPSLRRGDGLCFFSAGGELLGAQVREVQGRKVFPEKLEGLQTGAQVFRNYDHDFMEALKKCRPERKIGVAFHLRRTPAGLQLSARDADGCEASASIAFDCWLAEKPEQALATIHQQLRKLGGTEFTCDQITLHLPEVVFVPVSVLNELRRAALQALSQARLAARPQLTGGVQRNSVPFPEPELSFHGNVLNAQAEAFYRRHGVMQIEPAAESGLDLRGRKVMTNRYCLKYELGACPRYAQENPPARLNEPLRLVDEQGNIFYLRFNCRQCQMEIYAG